MCTILLKISPQFQNIWNIFSPLQRVSLYVSLLHERWHVQRRAGQRSGHRRQGDLLTKQAACMPHFKDKIHSALCTAFFCPTWRLFCRHQLSGVNSLLSIHLPVCVCVSLIPRPLCAHLVQTGLACELDGSERPPSNHSTTAQSGLSVVQSHSKVKHTHGVVFR